MPISTASVSTTQTDTAQVSTTQTDTAQVSTTQTDTAQVSTTQTGTACSELLPRQYRKLARKTTPKSRQLSGEVLHGGCETRCARTALGKATAEAL